jgi:hypothetical protein
MVEYWQAASRKRQGEMSEIFKRFQTFHRQNTRQIGALFCIPASISNALRILGVDAFSQERIRDLWYADQGKVIEPSINSQMVGFSFDQALSVLSNDQALANISHELFARPGDSNLLDLSKSNAALSFIENHLAQNHPVIISTQIIPWEQGILNVVGYHMLLALEINIAQNVCILHDPGNDLLVPMQIVQNVSLMVGANTLEFPIGLLGKITHSDYNCLALWRN